MSKPNDAPPLPEALDVAVDWLVRLRGGTLSEADTHAFADWLSQDLAHAQAFAKAEDFFYDLADMARLPPAEAQAVQSVASAKPSQRMRPPRWLAIPVALAASWLFAVGLLLPDHTNPFTDLFSDFHTRPGELREITLSDGSQVLLNTSTAISVDYQANRRHVILHHGQARFSVAKDAQRPFEVETGPVVVRALGTVFEVYQKQDDDIEITVQEHAIAARLGEDDTVTVQAGQQLHYQGGNLPNPVNTQLSQATAWQHRRLFINDRPLAELVAELERYRLGRIFLDEPQLRSLPVTGVFPIDQPDDALATVCQVLGLHETRIGWWVVLHQ